MKVFIFLFFPILLLTSCSTIKEKQIIEEEKVKPPKIKSKFMSHKQIREEFIRLQEAEQMDERLDKDSLERLKYTIKDESFIHPKQLSELKAAIKDREWFDQIFKIKLNTNGVDRSNCDNKAISQCGGTCTSHAITNAMDNLLCKPQKQNSSNEHLWSKYKKYSTWSGIETAAKVKICEDKYWPNCKSKKPTCNSNLHVGLKSWEYLGNDIDRIKESLENGHPLVYSGKVTKSWVRCDAVINPKSSPTGGGHAVAVVGYKEDDEIIGGGYLKILNSWGDDCGDNGYQYLPFHYLKRTDGKMYAFAHEIKEIYSIYNDGEPEPNLPEPEPECKKVRKCGPWKRIWYMPWKKYRKCGPWKVICK